jgi:hypothetical protein
VALVEALLLAPRVLHPQLHALLHQARHLGHGRDQCKVVFAKVEEDESGCSTPLPHTHYRDGIMDERRHQTLNVVFTGVFVWGGVAIL